MSSSSSPATDPGIGGLLAFAKKLTQVVDESDRNHKNGTNAAQNEHCDQNGIEDLHEQLHFKSVLRLDAVWDEGIRESDCGMEETLGMLDFTQCPHRERS